MSLTSGIKHPSCQLVIKHEITQNQLKPPETTHQSVLFTDFQCSSLNSFFEISTDCFC